MKLSLRNRMLLPIIAVIFIGMGVSSYMAYRSARDSLYDASINYVETVTSSLALQVDLWVKDLKADLTVLAEEEAVTELAEYGGADPSMVARTNMALKRFFDKYDFYNIIALTDLNGVAVASSNESKVGKLNVSSRKYFKESLGGATYVSDVLKSKSTGKPVFVVSFPMKINGQVKGVFLASIDLSVFSSRFIDPVKVGNEGYAFMAGQGGLIAAHPNKSAIMKVDLKTYDWGRAMYQQKNGLNRYQFEGVEKLVSFRTVPGTGWVIAAGASISDIFHAAKSLRNQSIIVSLIVVVLAGLVVLFILKPVLQAVKQGVGLAEIIAKGIFHKG